MRRHVYYWNAFSVRSHRSHTRTHWLAHSLGSALRRVKSMMRMIYTPARLECLISYQALLCSSATIAVGWSHLLVDTLWQCACALTIITIRWVYRLRIHKTIWQKFGVATAIGTDVINSLQCRRTSSLCTSAGTGLLMCMWSKAVLFTLVLQKANYAFRHTHNGKHCIYRSKPYQNGTSQETQFITHTFAIPPNPICISNRSSALW